METRAQRMMMGLIESGGLFDYGPSLSRVLCSTWKSLARGEPVTQEQVTAIAADARASLSEANEFLSRVTERDARGNIVGVLGLSLREHAHTFLPCAKIFLTLAYPWPKSLAKRKNLKT